MRFVHGSKKPENYKFRDRLSEAQMSWMPNPWPTFIWPKLKKSDEKPSSSTKEPSETKSSAPSKKSTKKKNEGSDSDLSSSDDDYNVGPLFQRPIAETLVYRPKKGSFLEKGRDDNRESPPEKKIRTGVVVFDSGKQGKNFLGKKPGNDNNSNNAPKKSGPPTGNQIDKMLSSIRQEVEGPLKAPESKRSQRAASHEPPRTSQRHQDPSYHGKFGSSQDFPASSQSSYDANRSHAPFSSIHPNRGIHPSLLATANENPPWLQSTPHIPEPHHLHQGELQKAQSSYGPPFDESQSLHGSMSQAPAPMSHIDDPPPWLQTPSHIPEPVHLYQGEHHKNDSSHGSMSHAPTPMSHAAPSMSQTPMPIGPTSAVPQPSPINPSTFQALGALSNLIPTSSSAFQALSSLLPSGISLPGLPMSSAPVHPAEVSKPSQPELSAQPDINSRQGLNTGQGSTLPVQADIPIQKEAPIANTAEVPQSSLVPETVPEVPDEWALNQQRSGSTSSGTTGWSAQRVHNVGAGWPKRPVTAASQPNTSASTAEVPTIKPLGNFSDITDEMILVRIQIDRETDC